jgi:hypothetical protein
MWSPHGRTYRCIHIVLEVGNSSSETRRLDASSRASHVHQMPQTGHAQMGPVTSTTVAENDTDFARRHSDRICSTPIFPSIDKPEQSMPWQRYRNPTRDYGSSVGKMK